MHTLNSGDMVKALHKAGISVILDINFSHTAEGGADGPTINFKGINNEIFYQLDFNDRRMYRDYSDEGNTINCNHPLVNHFLVESLEYWVREMHVDGFRFYHLSTLVRGEDGHLQHNTPIMGNIELSPNLFKSHFIGETWDAAGLFQVGGFSSFRLTQWNGRYRDVIRSFVRGDTGMIGEIAARLAGSADIYEPYGLRPYNGINFITCHEGFTLHDLVSYQRKSNEANGKITVMERTTM